MKEHDAPTQWMGFGGWPLGRLGLAVRPDEIVRAVLVCNQPGVDSCRERRIVDGSSIELISLDVSVLIKLASLRLWRLLDF